MQHHLEAQEFLSDLLQSMQELPYEAGLLRELFSQTSDTSPASLEAVAQTISRGQGIAARVLSMANSAYYGLQSEVASVSRAVAVLGMKEVRNLVLSLGISDVTASRKLPRQFALAEYWIHQVSVGEAARLIARHAMEAGEQVDPDTLYTAGLLHDLGKLFIAAFRPLTWAAIRSIRERDGLSDVQAEDRYWGVDHAVIAAHVLSYWNLPEELTEPISWHHQPHLAASHKRGAAILFTADALLHSRQDGGIPLNDNASALLRRFVRDTRRFEQQLESRLDAEQIRALVSHLL